MGARRCHGRQICAKCVPACSIFPCSLLISRGLTLVHHLRAIQFPGRSFIEAGELMQAQLVMLTAAVVADITIGPLIVDALRPLTDAPLDTHL